MSKIMMWAITAALAGFLFGFDVVVISGADKKLQLLWNSSDAFHGAVVMGMALWGTVIGYLRWHTYQQMGTKKNTFNNRGFICTFRYRFGTFK